jgi:hypothetical protein
MLDSGSGQTLECVVLKRTDLSTCVDCETGINILRSEKPVPKALETDFGLAYLNASFQNGVSIDFIDKTYWQTKKKRRYSLSSCGCYLVNEHICLVDYEDIDEVLINIDGHFENPEEVTRLNLLNNPDCTSDQLCLPIYDLEFQCPGHIIRRALEIVRTVVFRKLGIPLDTSNNSKFDPHVESKP